MRLVDAGRIDLERPIKELLEDFVLSDKGAEEKITMKHLLTHTSGTKGDYFKDFGYGKDALEKLVRNMSSLPQINPPGRILSYCNSGFYVAGRPSKKQSSNWFLGLSVWRTFISSPKI